jgi:hypothetical protein
MPAAKKKAPAKKIRSIKRAAPLAAPIAIPRIRGIFAMILDTGVIITATTELDSPPVTLIQAAAALAKSVSQRKVPSTSLFSVVAPDKKLGRDVRVYVGFVAVQNAVVIPGTNTFNARFAYSARKILDSPFSVVAQPLASFKRDQLINFFTILHEPLKKLLSVALASNHPFAQAFNKFHVEHRLRLEWQDVKAKIKQAVDAGQSAQAIELLAPKVFSESPVKEAEKLLGDLLFASLPAEQRKKFENAALRSLQVEALLLRQALLTAGRP